MTHRWCHSFSNATEIRRVVTLVAKTPIKRTSPGPPTQVAYIKLRKDGNGASAAKQETAREAWAASRSGKTAETRCDRWTFDHGDSFRQIYPRKGWIPPKQGESNQNSPKYLKAAPEKFRVRAFVGFRSFKGRRARVQR